MNEPLMKTIPNVPIVSTGTYHLGGNAYGQEDTTFTAEDLADAVAATQDPAVALPRLKLGHTSKWGDAEPAFGKVDNLRVGDNGQTIYGDYTGTPAWLADIMPVVYPNRSIEAFFNVKTPTGNTYRMVITAVALLGVTLPGVATLEDLAGLYAEEVPDGTDIESAEKVEAQMDDKEIDVKLFKRKVSAAVNLEDVRRNFYETIATGDNAWWWIREMYLDPSEIIVDSDDGDLYRMPFEIKGEEIEWGEPESVKVQYVAAERGGDQTPASAEALVFASRADSVPDNNKEEDQVDSAELRSKLGLPADATDEDVERKLTEVRGETPPEPQPGSEPQPQPGAEPEEPESPSDDDEGDDDVTEEPAADDQRTVDSLTLANLQRDAALGRQAHERQQEQERDAFLQAAVDEGKFPPARLDHYRKAYAADPEGTRSVIDNLEPGLVPVAAKGSGGAEGVGEADTTYPREWLSAAEQDRAAGKVTASGAGTVTREEV